MTLIVAHRDRKGGTVRLYADTKVSFGNGTFYQCEDKIFEHNGIYYAFGGSNDYVSLVSRFIKQDHPPVQCTLEAYTFLKELQGGNGDDPELAGIAITGEGDILYMSAKGEYDVIKDDVFAVGAGSDVFLGFYFSTDPEDYHEHVKWCFERVAELNHSVDGCTWREVIFE